MDYYQYGIIMIKVAFLIGNGTSREGLDLELFRNKGTIIGCNALHRDFTPDTLMAVDQKMIDEIGGLKWKIEKGSHK